VCANVHAYVCAYVCVNVRVFVCICVCTLLDIQVYAYEYRSTYVLPTITRLLQVIGLFCKKNLQKRLYSAKETYTFKEPTNRSHPGVYTTQTYTPRTCLSTALPHWQHYPQSLYTYIYIYIHNLHICIWIHMKTHTYEDTYICTSRARSARSSSVSPSLSALSSEFVWSPSGIPTRAHTTHTTHTYNTHTQHTHATHTRNTHTQHTHTHTQHTQHTHTRSTHIQPPFLMTA